MASRSNPRCPHCRKSLGSVSREGKLRLRLSVVLIDEDTGAISGPCGKCGSEVEVSSGGTLSKAVTGEPDALPGVRIAPRV